MNSLSVPEIVEQVCVLLFVPEKWLSLGKLLQSNGMQVAIPDEAHGAFVSIDDTLADVALVVMDGMEEDISDQIQVLLEHVDFPILYSDAAEIPDLESDEGRAWGERICDKLIDMMSTKTSKSVIDVERQENNEPNNNIAKPSAQISDVESKASPFDYLTRSLFDALQTCETLKLRGRVIQVVGTVVKAIAPQARVGELCLLRNTGDRTKLPAEVIGFEDNVALLTPMGEMVGVSSATEVEVTGQVQQVVVGDHLRGQVLNCLGEPLESRFEAGVASAEKYPVCTDPPDPLARKVIDTHLMTGVRAIDAFLTCGEGQRLGVFAAAGVGKSTLLGMLAKNSEADITVVALIGERGREVREFIEHVLGSDGMANAVVVVATSDRPAIERMKAAYVATSIAEYFRDKGLKVLLLMDSVTRFARALREIGLAAGEAPTRRGFPSSAFSTLPKLMERAGHSEHGSITAFYTVLVEGDDLNEPVADESRSILDGHIVLSRDLAAANHYPAIDVLASLSRVMPAVVSEDHRDAAGYVRELMAKYKEVELLLRIGEYQKGEDVKTDEAIEKIEAIKSLLRQDVSDIVDFDETVSQLQALTKS